ncbi:hypothetical protein PsYK624_160120 [Phanerochaete sordida]|uniref:Uncharacterized protein n=1 Tax=Phanerochaete sordida TaxID=48140 RepID=A0A9P3GRC6_9APHY|nr:hypothetical protein PsYK624_160120 [Phanerochaete sordida]
MIQFPSTPDSRKSAVPAHTSSPGYNYTGLLRSSFQRVLCELSRGTFGLDVPFQKVFGSSWQASSWRQLAGFATGSMPGSVHDSSPT